MAAKSKNKLLIRLKCSKCDRINYYVYRRKDAEKKLQLNKFCKWCRAYVNHKEAKH
ncbi:MAG: 50S ribosomal protein L33 [Patescibacteria group bacterium]|nr:50S ribosomal protein L33 [Patescibacteria group bacterium]